MNKIITIIGARPQFIKAAAVSRILQNNPAYSDIIVHTGQHYDDNLSQIFFNDLEIPQPKYNLEVGSASHGKQTGDMLARIEDVLLQEKANLVLVYGDTNTTLAGALAATKLHIPVAHIEAGLRSFNKKMPEEINRIVADQLSQLLFAPTQQAVTNLEKEGHAKESIHWVGDVMHDVAIYAAEKAKKNSKILEKLQLTTNNYILATVHRPENTNQPLRLEAIFKSLMYLSEKIPVVLPLHPRTKKYLKQIELLESVNKNITLLEPVGFLDMVMLEKNAALIATDSGGVQKEAFFYQIPCVTLREETEWVELVDLGWNTVVHPLSEDVIISAIKKALTSKGKLTTKPYGDGNAAGFIVDKLASFMNSN